MRRGLYGDATPAPGGSRFAIENGEGSIFAQYLAAIAAARRSIYIEDQAIGAPQIVDALHAALERGVEVVFLAPIDPNEEMAAGRRQAESRAFFERLGALGAHEHFALVGIAANRAPGAYENVYVHAKIALVDDAWATIGSANVGNRSFFGDTELNASFWDEPTVRALRAQLLREHLGRDTSQLDDRAAFALYRQIARDNGRRRERGEPLDGMALALDPALYASDASPWRSR